MATLLLIDLQPDFLPGGALAVSAGDEVLAVAEELRRTHRHVVATQDWHPADHESFASQHEGKEPGQMIDLHGLPQVLWPDHCVMGTAGAELAIPTEGIDEIVRKGSHREVDSYSGFFDNGKRNDTGLHAYLQAQDVTELVVMGLATDYCVKFTVLDALALGYRVKVVRAGCRAVNLQPGDGDNAFAEMQAAGATLV